MTDELRLEDLPQPEEETTVFPDELEVDGDNPNEQTDEMFGLLCENMRKRGWIGNAIVADTDGVIADGEHRWRAAQEIGLREVPVKFYDIDDAERRLWRQELNKISGEHDSKRDALEYDFLLDNGMSDEVQSLTRAAGEDLDELLEEIKLQGDRPAQYDYDPEHNVYFEDCVEGMRERLDDNSVDMVFTSPPYNIDKGSGKDRTRDTVEYEDTMGHDEFVEFLSTVGAELNRVVKDSGHIFINFGKNYIDNSIYTNWWVKDTINRPLASFIVWDKGGTSSKAMMSAQGKFYDSWEPIYHFTNSTSPLDGKARDLWECDLVRGGTRESSETGEHPAPFSVELVSKAIEHTTSEGDTILDPFMGSGTTAVAAIQNDRNYIGFELDEEGAYKPIIERRIGEAKRAKDSSVNNPDKAEADD